MKTFLMSALNQVDYLRRMSKSAFIDMVYQVEFEYHEAGKILQKPGDAITSMIVIILSLIHI